MANVIYTANDILEQEFKTKMRGYDPVEVDEFLDNVIKDYEAYNKELLVLKEENDRLKAKIEQLSKAQSAPSRIKESSASSAVTNFDILKRLSNLEREVFGKKIDQQSRSIHESTVGDTFTENYTHAEDDNEKTRQF